MSVFKRLFILTCISLTAAFFFEKRYPGTEIERSYVPPKLQHWKRAFSDYEPAFYSAPCQDCDPDIGTDGFSPLFNNLDAKIDRRRPRSAMFQMEKRYRVENGYPLNPLGRTGLRGRGDLRRWGPNLLTVFIFERGVNPIEFAVIDSNATSSVLPAFPEFFMDNPAENIFSCEIVNVFRENLATKYYKDNVDDIVDEGFRHKYDFWSGYLASQRNTDNAWIELMVYQFQDTTYETFGMTNFTGNNNKLGLKWKVIDPKMLKLNLKEILFHSKSSVLGTLKRRLLLKHLGLKSRPVAYVMWILRVLITSLTIFTGSFSLIAG